jgi:hypothetical protein
MRSAAGKTRKVQAPPFFGKDFTVCFRAGKYDKAGVVAPAESIL